MARPYPRFAFLEQARQPRAVFYTSSTSKYLQARLIFSLYGLELTQRAHAELEYEEDYTRGPEFLLQQAVAQVSRRSGGGTLFFIEDTSIRVDALSGESEFPGLRAKEWFQETSFEVLDAELSRRGNRRASVTSRIALSLPGLNRPIIFTGVMEGTIVDELPMFQEDPLFPWLSRDNFSAWIIPDGATRTLSEMSFEESLDYDFRVKSVQALIDRLEEYTVAANSSSTTFAQAPKSTNADPALFTFNEPILLVIGPTCSGKTTFGMVAQATSRAQVVDASSIVRILRAERGEEQAPIGHFASELLRAEGPDIVARQIWDQSVRGRDRDIPLIITGFRAIEEVQFFRQKSDDVRVISIEAPPRLRYERYQERRTRTKISSIEEFYKHDAEQHDLGLLPVAGVLADLRVENVHSLEIYYSQVRAVLTGELASANGIHRVVARLDPERSQLLRCLQILRSVGRPLTTQEIQAHFGGETVVLYNNANKILKRYPSLVRRQESRGANVRYQITASGLAFLSATESLSRG